MPYLYDSSFFYYYCMYKNLTYNDLELHSNAHRFNSGLFIVNSDFITQDDVDEYVDFCKGVHEDKVFNTFHDSKKTSGMRLTYTEDNSKDDDKHALFHPSDEVFFQYQRFNMNKKHEGTYYPVLDSSWNYIGNAQYDLENVNHIHCIDKSQIPIALEKSNVK